MLNKSRNTGITLIALVISIIVLLILAGISISMLSGNNGLLTKTVESKEETRGGTVQEQRDLWMLEKTADNYTESQTATSLANLLEDLGPNGQKLLTAEDIETINETGQVTIGSRTIVFKEIFTIGSEYDKGHIKIGDKLSYSANEANDWIVFGKDDDGNVLLTTETGVSNYSPTHDAKHWEKWDENLDTVCSIYGGEVQGLTITARSISLADINRVVGFTEPNFKTYKFTTDEDANYSKQKVNIYYPNGTLNTFQKATTTSFEAESNSSIPAKNFLDNSYQYYKNGDNYILNRGASLADSDNEIIDLTKNLKNVDNMIYIVGKDNELSYWIANHAACINDGNANFYVGKVTGGRIGCAGNDIGPTCSTYGSGGFNGGFMPNSQNGAIRPIVEIPSSIEVQEISSGAYGIK